MIKLLLAVIGAWAAYRYRGPIKEYVNRQLPEVQKKATSVFAERRPGQA
jgi:hypothetical protein